MPPAQCPECGRFLAKAFVAGLATTPAPCPKCETVLGPEQFAGTDADSVADSVRPPDLDPTDVRLDEAGDVDPLAGWDEPGGDVVSLDRFAEAGAPPDYAIVAGAAAAGAVAAAVIGRRKGVAAVLGALLGALAAAIARQVWRLEECPAPPTLALWPVLYLL